MKKKIVVIAAGITCLFSNANACYGCLDYGVSSMQATMQELAFKTIELKLTAELNTIALGLQKAMQAMEIENQTKSVQFQTLRSYQALKQQEAVFLMQQNNKLQSIANELRGVQ